MSQLYIKLMTSKIFHHPRTDSWHDNTSGIFIFLMHYLGPWTLSTKLWCETLWRTFSFVFVFNSQILKIYWTLIAITKRKFSELNSFIFMCLESMSPHLLFRENQLFSRILLKWPIIEVATMIHIHSPILNS